MTEKPWDHDLMIDSDPGQQWDWTGWPCWHMLTIFWLVATVVLVVWFAYAYLFSMTTDHQHQPEPVLIDDMPDAKVYPI